MTALSGRTREHLQAEADLLAAQEDLEFAKRHLSESLTLQVIMANLARNFKNHHRQLQHASDDLDREVSWATSGVERARKTLEKAEEAWKQQ